MGSAKEFFFTHSVVPVGKCTFTEKDQSEDPFFE